jgi:hypothetical protein
MRVTRRFHLAIDHIRLWHAVRAAFYFFRAMDSIEPCDHMCTWHEAMRHRGLRRLG